MIKRILLLLIIIYQKVISPLKPRSCRFIPTCSYYALEAINKYGTYKGTKLAFKRLIKCHPFHPGGYDPLL